MSRRHGTLRSHMAASLKTLASLKHDAQHGETQQQITHRIEHLTSRIARLEHDIHDILSTPLPQPPTDGNGMQRKLSFRAASLKLKHGSKDSPSLASQPSSVVQSKSTASSVAQSKSTASSVVQSKSTASSKAAALSLAASTGVARPAQATPSQGARKPTLAASSERGSLSSVLDEGSTMETKSLTKQNSIQQLIVTAGGDGGQIERGTSLADFDLNNSNASNPFEDEDSDNGNHSDNDGNSDNDDDNDGNDARDLAANYIEINGNEPSALAAIVLGQDSSVLSGTLPVLSADPVPDVAATAASVLDHVIAQPQIPSSLAELPAQLQAVVPTPQSPEPKHASVAVVTEATPEPEVEETIDPVLLLMAALGSSNVDDATPEEPVPDQDDEPVPAPPSEDERRPSMPRLFSSPSGSRSGSLEDLASRVAAKVQASTPAQGSPLAGSPLNGTSPQSSPTASPPKRASNLGQLDFAPVAKVQRAQRVIVKQEDGSEPEDEDVCRLMPSEA